MSDQQMPAHMLEELPEDMLEALADAANIAPSEDNMARLLRLANEASALEKTAFDHETKMMEADEARLKIVRVAIPELLKELGMKEFMFEDGRKVDVGEKITASISDVNKREAHEWMEKNGFGGLIKTTVSASFGKGDIETARKAQCMLTEAGHFAELEQSVHYQTLQSFAKEQLGKGASLPPCINIFTIEEATVKPPKGQKAVKRLTQKKK